MTAKQAKQTAKLINAAMLKLQDARESLRLTDSEELTEDPKIRINRHQSDYDIEGAICKLHWTMARLEELQAA